MALMLCNRFRCAFFTTYHKTQSKLLIQNVTARFKYVVPSSAMSSNSLELSINNPDKFKKMQDKWRSSDKIPEKFQLIYKTDLNNYLGGASFMTAICAATGIFGIIFGKLNEDVFLNTPFEGKTMVIAGSMTEIYVVSGFSIIMLIVLKYLTRNLALRIYNCEKEYIAVYQGFLPGIKRKLSFESGEMEQSKRSIFLPWEESNYRVRNQNCLILPAYFRTPLDFHKMLDDDPKILDEEEIMKKMRGRNRRSR